MYCILYLLSGLIRIRRNSSLGPQELCQSKSCLGPSTQSQLELRGERRRRRHRSLPPASAANARRSREEGRWKKRAWKGPHWIWLLSSVVQSTRLRSLQSKRGCCTEAEAAEPFSTVTEFGKLRGVGSNEDPNRCLEKREARSFDGGGGGGGGADGGGGGGKSTLKVSKAFSGALQWTTPRAARHTARRWRLGAVAAAASRSSVGSGSLTSTGRDGQPVRKLVLAVQCTATQPLLPSLAFSLFQLLLFGTKINTPLSGAPNFYSIAFHTPTNVIRSGAAIAVR